MKIIYRKNKENKMCSKGTISEKGKTNRDFNYLIEMLNHESPLRRSIAIVELMRTAGDINPVPYIITAKTGTDELVRSTAALLDCRLIHQL
jgi:hypothetical protein